MTYSAYLLGVLFVALSPQMCPAIYDTEPESGMLNKTYAMLDQIGPTLEKIYKNVKVFKVQTQVLLNRLNKNAMRDIANVNKSMQASLASLQSNIEALLTNANATDLGKCEDYAVLLAPVIPEMILVMKSCVNEVMSDAQDSIAFSLHRVKYILEAVAKIPGKADKCAKTIKGIKPTDTDAYEAYNCAKRSVWDVAYYNDVLAAITSSVQLSVLHREWAKQNGCCTTMSEAESFQYGTEIYYYETESCLAGTASP